MKLQKSDSFKSELSPTSTARALWKGKLLLGIIALLGTAITILVVHALPAQVVAPQSGQGKASEVGL